MDTAEPRPLPPSRRRRLRAVPLLVFALVSFAAGAVVGADGSGEREEVASRFAAAWTRGDYATMHALLTAEAKRAAPLHRFTALYRRAARTATVEVMSPAGEPSTAGDVVRVPMLARTRVFGDIHGVLEVPVEEDDEGAAVAWTRQLLFPGLRHGEELRRSVEMPPRGELRARDGSVLAAGEARTSTDLGPLAAEVVGRVGPIPPESAAEYEERGYPPDAIVGLTGLERQFEAELAGHFGGLLRAGGRVLASAQPRQARPVRTSISPRVQRAAVEALAGRFGGVAVLRPRTGEVLALAGIAYSAPQPPGSTFKVVTLAGALEARIVKRSDEFPVQTFATLEGVELENAHGESCGGSLTNSFAHSCNSVFAPLGAELGAERLVRAAEAFGFNETPEIVGAQPSTIPAAGEIGDDLAVGSTAIGQGRLLATPLHLASVAATIANRGVYVRPTLTRGQRGRATRVVSARTARIVDGMMRAVVRYGTGTAASLPGVAVAGKTGTAELRDTTPDDEDSAPGEEPPPPDDATDTDAWFIAYAPASKPRLAVAVLLVGQGAGGETAAPVARAVLAAGL